MWTPPVASVQDKLTTDSIKAIHQELRTSLRNANKRDPKYRLKIVSKLLKKLHSADFLQSAANSTETSVSTRVKISKYAGKISKLIFRLLDDSDEGGQGDFTLASACIFVHLSAMTQDASHLVTLLHLLFMLRANWTSMQDVHRVNGALLE